MAPYSRTLNGLMWLLLCVNGAFVCLCIGVGSLLPKSHWSVMSTDPVTVWLASHYTDWIPWFVLASALLSLGIWLFVAARVAAPTEAVAAAAEQSPSRAAPPSA